MTPLKPLAFATPRAFRAWLRKNHRRVKELSLRCYKTHALEQGVTYRQALDEALCFGWIDGVRHALDDDSFTVRFTPRRAKSKWSAVNIRRVAVLEAEGRMEAPGLEAFRTRVATPAGYSFETRERVELDAESLKRFRSRGRAWKFFQAQAPYYRRLTTHWVMSAKREETRVRRLDLLIASSDRGKPIPGLERASKGSAAKPRKSGR